MNLAKQIVSSVAWALAVAVLIAPPTLASTLDLPDHFDIVWEDIGVSLSYSSTENGYVYEDASDSEHAGFIGADSIDAIDVVALSDRLESISAIVNVPDGAGGTRSFSIAGSYDRTTETFAGDVFLPNGNHFSGVNFTLPGSGVETNAVVIVIVGAGIGLGILACAIIQWATDCGEECSNGCAKEGLGMESYEELRCGRCKCQCQAL